MQKNLAEILGEHDPLIIETALVQLFVEANGILVKRNTLIKKMLGNKDEDVLAAKELLIDKVEAKNITDFVNIFELLVPRDDKKINGAFFTPKIITNFVVSQTITSPSQKVCDPSCGCGAFLIAAAIFISEKFGKNVIDIIEENLYGVDISDYSVRRVKILLSLLSLKNGRDKENIKFNLKTADSLVVDWKKLFYETNKGEGFDVVIGNPPYVKFQDLNKELREKLYKDWLTLKTGNYNLYFAFFELGVAIIKAGGVLGYITPNNYFTSLSGIQLRGYLESNKLIEKIIDFNHLKLFEAQTYTCITFLKKKAVDFVDGSTLKNDYYHKFYKERSYQIEKNITKPIVKISDFKSQDDLDKNSRRIIFPYQKPNGRAKINKENELKKLYPYFYEYLLAAKIELITRDKGGIEYPEWYAYARTQGLNFLGEKLITPTFSSEPRFLLEKNENALFCNGYAIYSIAKPSLFSKLEQPLSLGVLSKILNSRVMDYYIKRTSVSIEGGYPCYQKNFIELLGVPNFTPKELNFLNKESDQKIIDNFLIEKYDINIDSDLENHSTTKPLRVNSKQILSEVFNS